jgi:hypothetical protein
MADIDKLIGSESRLEVGRKINEIIEYKPNADLSNLSATGEKHFLNKTQVTNCLIEVPQRIKYELNDGVITVKKGSVFIIPYGTADLKSQYPVGSTFLNSNWKVIDTQYGGDQTTGKFFVWVELQQDVSRDLGSSTGLYMLQLATSGSLSWYGIASSNSGATEPTITSSAQFYNTTENYNKAYNSGTFNQYLTLPFALVTLASGKITNIDQIFNGAGYIGGAYWIDRGIKFISGNGKNNDGTLKNREFTTHSLRMRQESATYTRDNLVAVALTSNYLTYYPISDVHVSETEPTPKTWSRWYKPSENQWYETGDATVWKKFANPPIYVADFSYKNGKIYNWKSHQTFRAIDYAETKILLEETRKNSVTKQEITNCITEVPQRIKYTLENGTLTIKKGSVVIVPYGTTDQSSKYPIGGWFINSNFIVTDVQFSNNQFFVWAELQKDLTKGYTVTHELDSSVLIDLTNSGISNFLIDRQISGDNPVATMNYTGVYNTATNRVGICEASTSISYSNVLSLPLIVCKAANGIVYSMVKSIFNGFGYIGQHRWHDKNIKGLIGISRNDDGTINNQEIVTNFSITAGHNYTEDRLVGIAPNGSVQDTLYSRVLKGHKYEMPTTVNSTALQRYVCTDTLECFYTSGSTTANWQLQQPFVPLYQYGATSPNDGTCIRYIKPYSVFRAVDYNDINQNKIDYRITQLQNTPRTMTILFEGPVGKGNITLADDFINYESLVVIGASDSTNYYTLVNIVPTYWLDYCLSNYTSAYLWSSSTNYWVLKGYANGTTTKQLVPYNENAVIQRIIGINKKVESRYL